jgi:hypothetical protein
MVHRRIFWGAFLCAAGLLASGQSAHADDEDYQAPAWKARTIDESVDYDAPRYSLALILGLPKFPAIQAYGDFYGRPSLYPELRVTYDLFRTHWVAAYVGLGIIYYTDTGSQIKVPASPDDPLESASGSLQLTMYPYHFLAGAQVTPFGSKTVGINGWIGYEELTYSEVRTNTSDTGTAKQPTTSTTPTTTAVSGSSSEGEYSNTGTNAALVYGVSLNINVSEVEEENVRSMKGTMNFSQIFIAPFYEKTVKMDLTKAFIARRAVSPVNFQREAFGISFIFATAR